VTDPVFIGLGSNLGDRLANLGAALHAISALEDTHLIAVSNAVESEPWGVIDQPPFANAVARVATGIGAERFCEALKDIEAAMGREPTERNGPRVIDLDILLFGDEEWQAPHLVVPHPRLAERDFVVTPLLEIAPHATWPTGEPITRKGATQGRVTGVLGPVPDFEQLTPVAGASFAGGPGQPSATGPRAGGPDASMGADPSGGAGIEGWETVASVYAAVRMGLAFAPELFFDAAMLEQEGIPVAWDPFVPGDETLPWPLPRTFRLLVPSAHAARARAVLADAHAAGVTLEGMPPSGPGFEEDGSGEE
jgi:2-amino-4-hydroxy-6-hydroxymethyldihydropteridine diphosphokinase